MHIQLGLSDLYELEPLQTERTAAHFLRKWENDYPITFVDYPWSVIINKNISIDLPKVENGFVVCQHIDYEQMLDKWWDAGVRQIFSPHYISGALGYIWMDLIPFPHLAYNKLYMSEYFKKEYLFSFCGAKWTHHTREQLSDLIDNFWREKYSCFFLDSGRWHLEKPSSEKNGFESFYSSLMGKSVFSLCPRGTGPGTIRFWEALAHGSIPVVISDNWEPPEFEVNFFGQIYNNWNDLIIRVSENSLEDIPSILLSVDNVDLRSKLCKLAYQYFSGHNFINPIKNYYKEIYQDVSKT